jgi:hypothetical protein
MTIAFTCAYTKHYCCLRCDDDASTLTRSLMLLLLLTRHVICGEYDISAVGLAD